MGLVVSVIFDFPPLGGGSQLPSTFFERLETTNQKFSRKNYMGVSKREVFHGNASHVFQSRIGTVH
jgi:hypothetical protein